MPKSTLKMAAWLLFLALFSVLLSSCAQLEANRPRPLEVTDQMGRAVRLEGLPRRIVSLAPSNTEILFALGLGERVAGVTDYCDFPPEAKGKPKVGGFATVDMEKIVALAPDLVVAAASHEKKVVPELERRGLAVIVLAPKTLNGVIEAVILTGRATGKEEAARQLAENMRGRIEAVQRLVASSKNRPRVFYIVWHDPLQTAGRGTFINQLIEEAGGTNIFADLNDYPTVDLELLLKRNPQFILVNAGHGAAESLPLSWAKNEKRLRVTEALRESRVYEIDANLVNRSGPRIVEGLEEMLRFIHPELQVK